MQLKEDQWYQLPSGQWAKAVCVDDPEGAILQGYGVDLHPQGGGYKPMYFLDVDPNGTLRGVTGTLT